MPYEKLEYLVKEYEEEYVDFSKESCAKLLNLYMERMEGSQLKALLYMYLKHNGGFAMKVYPDKEYP